jgi:ankyrin repeat protein
MEQGYLAQVQALIDQKWKENPEEMKRVMAEIEAKEKAEKKKPKAKTQKWRYVDPQLTQELIKEMNQSVDDIDMPRIQILIERGADVNAKDSDGRTPLHWASYFNAIETAKLLIENGADVKAKDNWGQTPLHLASYSNYIELAKLLIERGADVNAKDKYGRTPLDLAGSDEMKTLLKKYQK